jgi:sugar phosphate isomerase/epimerase
MKIAAHTMGTPEMPLPEAIRLFAAQDFDGIEIIWDDEYQCALRKGASEAQVSELARMLSDHGLAASCLTPYMTGLDTPGLVERKRNIDEFRRCIDAASMLRAPCIRVYGGAYLPENREIRADLEEALVSALLVLCRNAVHAGVTLALETHFNTLTCTAAETAEIVRRVDDPRVRVLYDQPNLEFSGGEKHAEALEILNGLIAMVHVKDLVYKEGAQSGFSSSKVVTVDESERRISSRIPGEGIIPWPNILSALHAQGYDGWLSLEYERRWYPHDLPPASEGMKRGLEYIRSIVASLE